MTTDSLIHRLLEAGLLQPGIFEEKADIGWHWRLDMLPSYPDVLAELASGITPMLQGMPIDRLVCTQAALPLGVLVSSQTHLPLVYSRGQGEAPVYDLVGAYDIGHPTCLLVYQSGDTQIERIIGAGQSVGLNIVSVMALVHDAAPPLAIPLYSVLSSADVQRVWQATFKNGAF